VRLNRGTRSSNESFRLNIEIPFMLEVSP
jgi:hypothetical protein